MGVGAGTGAGDSGGVDVVDVPVAAGVGCFARGFVRGFFGGAALVVAAAAVAAGGAVAVDVALAAGVALGEAEPSGVG